MERNIRNETLVVVYDAGEAEIIGAHVLHSWKQKRYKVYAAGPSVRVLKRLSLSFTKFNPNRQSIRRIFENNPDISSVILGTGRYSLIVKPVTEEARSRKIRCIAYLESWANYRERFGYPTKNWRKNITDEIWVGDKYAENLARKYFPSTKIVFKKNRYFENIVREYRNLNKHFHQTIDLLFLSNGTPEEVGVLDELLAKLVDWKIKIQVRPHPVDPPSRFKEVSGKYENFIINISNKNSLVRDLARSRIVTGTETVAMVIALLCKVPVISLPPRGGIKRMVPFPGLLKVSNTRSAARIFKQLRRTES